MKNPDEYKPWKTIYEVIEDGHLDESSVNFPEEFLTNCIMEYNVPQFIPLEVKKEIQQVCIKYGLFSQIVDIKG